MSILSQQHYSDYQQPWNSRGGHGNISIADVARPEILPLLDAHWYHYPPLEPLWHAILACFVGTVGLLCVFGNGLVIYIFSTTKSLRSPSNLLIINLAISDFLMLFCMAPPMIINCYNETWVFGYMGCQVYGMLGSTFGCTSIWTMVVIAWDRYNVIAKGLAAKPLTVKGALFQITLVWLHSFFWTWAPFFGWNRYVPEGNLTACGTDYFTKGLLSESYIVLYCWFCYGQPLLAIIYAYYYIIKAVSAHERSMREQAKKMNVASLRSDGNNTSAEYKLAKVALMTISLWFVAWTPYLIINLGGVYDFISLSPLATIWGSVFAKANSCYNPIVYAISHPKFRLALNKKFPSLVCGKVSEPSSSDTQSVASGVTAITEDKPSA